MPVIVANASTHTVVVSRMQAVAAVRPSQRAVVVDKPSQVAAARRATAVVEVAAPGPQGPAGPAGGSSVYLQAGETMFGLRAVRASGGFMYRPDVAVVEQSDEIIGIVLQSGNAGAVLPVQMSGELSEPSWAWAPGAIYCGPDGVLTQAPPAAGWLLSIGRATSTTTIIIDIDTAFIRG